MPIKLAWGISPPEEVNAIAAYGARAIYHGLRVSQTTRSADGKRRLKKPRTVTDVDVDIVWDRQDAQGVEKKALVEWINSVGMSKIKAQLVECVVEPQHNIPVEFHDGRFHITANPKASYGYLYIGAWVS